MLLTFGPEDIDWATMKMFFYIVCGHMCTHSTMSLSRNHTDSFITICRVLGVYSLL